MGTFKFIVFQLLSLFLMGIDVQLSLFSGSVLPIPFYSSSYLFILWLIIVSRTLSASYTLFWTIFLGFSYDILFLDSVGVAIIALPTLIFLSKFLLKKVTFNALSYALVSLIIVFLFELLILGLSLMLDSSGGQWLFLLITYVFPTLLVNFVISFFVYFIYSRYFKEI